MKMFVVVFAFILSSQVFAKDVILCSNKGSDAKIQVHNSYFTSSNVVVTVRNLKGIHAYVGSAKSENKLIDALKTESGVNFKAVEGKSAIRVRVISLSEIEIDGQGGGLGLMRCHR